MTDNKKLLKEIFKTDKVIENFIKSMDQFSKHDDKSNSSKYRYIKASIKEIKNDLADIY